MLSLKRLRYKMRKFVNIIPFYNFISIFPLWYFKLTKKIRHVSMSVRINTMFHLYFMINNGFYFQENTTIETNIDCRLFSWAVKGTCPILELIVVPNIYFLFIFLLISLNIFQAIQLSNNATLKLLYNFILAYFYDVI